MIWLVVSVAYGLIGLATASYVAWVDWKWDSNMSDADMDMCAVVALLWPVFWFAFALEWFNATRSRVD